MIINKVTDTINLTLTLEQLLILTFF